MKQLQIILVIFLLPIISKAEFYNEGDSLYVNAMSGLVLRSQPNKKGIKIVKIPYDEKALILNTLGFSNFDKIENREGNWVYVSYENKKGYVFDGYLTKLRPIEMTITNVHLAPLLYYYFRDNYKEIEKQDSTWNEYHNNQTVRIFENGIKMFESTGGEGGSFYQFEITNGRMCEAINLIQNILKLENRDKQLKAVLKVEKDKDGKIIKYKADLEFNNEIEIQKKGNKIIINTWWAC